MKHLILLSLFILSFYFSAAQSDSTLIDYQIIYHPVNTQTKMILQIYEANLDQVDRLYISVGSQPGQSDLAKRTLYRSEIEVDSNGMFTLDLCECDPNASHYQIWQVNVDGQTLKSN